jgi:hypothetical protein
MQERVLDWLTKCSKYWELATRSKDWDGIVGRGLLDSLLSCCRDGIDGRVYSVVLKAGLAGSLEIL